LAVPVVTAWCRCGQTATVPPAGRLLQRRASADAAARSSVFLAAAEEAAGITWHSPSAPPLALDAGNQERAWELAATLIASAPTVTSPS
jgi:hypothetical protein